QGLGFSPRKVTISTSGITPKIKRLTEIKARYGLAISLHAANQIKREAIMPVAQTFALPGLMEAAREYSKAKNSKITFEYILFEDFNDQPEDVIALVKLIANINCKINLLSYNPVPGLEFHRPDAKRVDRFAAALSRKGVLVTVRQSRGLDIDAACGQLAIRERSQKRTG
ncbi:MAG: 23S rRNA (adenine(2503)-C(2))-methyltransferase RlmN, partial [candidate division Zixibacteria bacterium]|nr:23S rRNA (adenine(2503)-C(2))-methyltransferase RlmN [candidate division Zixibacteria bacterium]